MKLIQTSVLFILFLTTTFAAGDTAAPNIIDYFYNRGIGINYRPHYYQNLTLLIERKLKSAIAQSESHRQSDKEQAMAFYAGALEVLELYKDHPDMRAREAGFNLAKRMFYSMYSIRYEDRSMTWGERLKLITRFSHGMHYVHPEYWHHRIGREQASKEARYLMRDGEYETYLTSKELRKLTYLEVSELDLSPNHPGFYNNEFMRQKRDTWKELENWTQQSLANQLMKKNPQLADVYTLKQARQILFLTKIKESSTAPKLNAKDSFGMKWKVKFGNEVATEGVANRLYMKIGAKFTDLVYHTAPGELVLVLERPDKKGSCTHINSIKLLRRCFKKSIFKFEIKHHIYKSGVLNKNNIDQVLTNLSPYALKKYQKKNLLGRTYVTFHEALVEYKSNKILTRGGPTAGSMLGARRDRAARGLFIFNMWIWNMDAKDANNRGVILKDWDGKKNVYVDFMHDLGASLGKPSQPGNINQLKTGKKWLNPRGKRLIFRQFLLYRPKAWKDATFSDGRWMAKRMALIRAPEIEKIVKESGLPDFAQKALVYKLLKRRQRISQFFGVTEYLDQKEVPLLNISYSFRTPKERQDLALKYDLPLKLIERSLNKRGLLRSSGASSYIDKVVIKGQISDCKDSLLVNLLEKSHFPMGLARRQRRRKDHRPLKFCQFKGKN